LAGVGTSRPEPDYGIDLSLREIALVDGRYQDTSVQIDLQMRATTRAGMTETALVYDLDINAYNKLRTFSAGVPRVLVVLVLPEDDSEWLSQSPDQLSIRHCAYWLSLEGAPPSKASRSVRVMISLGNVFSPEAVRTLLQRARERR
jgi:hypothetical protein